MVRPEDDSSSQSSHSDESIARPDSEGWEDAEPDEEILQFKDFFSDKTFPDATSMIEYAATEHGFDFLKVTKDFGGCVCLPKVRRILKLTCIRT